MKRWRRGIILPVVLMVLLLIGLLAAMFAFRVQADVSGLRAAQSRLQTRLAAEAGIDRVKLLLRDHRFDVDNWYHNIDELHRVLVWIADGDESLWGTTEEFTDDRMAFRFSIVADDPTDDEHFVRFGITDEASKLNLNTCTEAQLLKLVESVVGHLEDVDPHQIVASILEWRGSGAGDAPQIEEAEPDAEYYRRLPRPYRIKNGPFDTVEELLLVRGVTGRVLFGEDFDRNGLLTPNEDDADRSFPPDNQDGVLDRGLYPYLTVRSAENNVSNDNRPRVYLFGEAESLREELSLAFPTEPQVVEFIVRSTRAEVERRSEGDNTENRNSQGGSGSTEEPDPGEDAGRSNTENEDGEQPDEDREEGAEETDDSESDDASEAAPPMRSPASLLRDAVIGDQSERSIVRPEHLPVLLDRTTTRLPEENVIPGLININTAPPVVLRCIEGLTDEHIEAILEHRDRLDGRTKSTTAWLLTEGVVDLDTFEEVWPYITARGQQFRIESLGYADHTGTMTRMEAIVDMVGPIAQTVYYRDVTYLGASFPIRHEDLERQRAR